MRRSGKRIAVGMMVPALVWSCLALAFVPDWPGWLALLLSWGWAGAVIAGNYLCRCSGLSLGTTGAGLLAILAFHLSQSPTGARPWLPEQERAVRVSFAGEEARVENLRHTIYREDGTVASREWYTDLFRVDEVERVDFVHEILSPSKLIAHGFLSFAFADGRHLAVSVEARRSEGQTYGPLRGLFRSYELIYILGQESDLIGMRANVRRNPVYLYPIRAEREEVQQLFRVVLRRADQLGREPEFYNTLTNNCITAILGHVNEVAERPIRHDLRLLLPGMADGLIHERGLLDFEGSRAEARQRFRINDRSAPVADPLEWSRQVRASADIR